MKRFGLAVAGALVVLSIATGSFAGTDHAVATGRGSFPDGSSLALNVENSSGVLQGTVWLYRDVPVVGAVQIDVSCVEVTSDWSLYPVPQPVHSLYASGTGSDGHAYFIAVHDRGAMGEFNPDQIAVSTTPATGRPCGAPTGSTPVLDGDFVIAA